MPCPHRPEPHSFSLPTAGRISTLLPPSGQGQSQQLQVHQTQEGSKNSSAVASIDDPLSFSLMWHTCTSHIVFYVFSLFVTTVDTWESFSRMCLIFMSLCVHSEGKSSGRIQSPLRATTSISTHTRNLQRPIMTEHTEPADLLNYIFYFHHF